jgi:hypothetical protein
MKSIYLLTVGLCFFLLSCRNDTNKQKVVVDRNQSSVNNSLSNISQNSILDSLIRKLKSEKYDISIDTTYKETIYFVRHKNILDKGDSLKIQTQRLITLKARRNYKIPNTLFYPKIKIQQISLNKTLDTEETFGQINQIITDVNDIYNDKIYDRIRQSESELFYIETDAKVFEEFVIHYDMYLKKIINAR